MNTKYLYIACVVLVVVFAALGFQARESRAIKIGYVGPLSGPIAASTGESVREALELAQRDMGTVAKAKIELIEEDDACDAKKAVTAAEKLITVDHVRVIVSMCSGSVLAIAPIAEAHHVLLISPVAGAPSITKAGDYVFRLSASSLRSGGAAARFAKQAGYHRVALLFENNEYPVGWKDAFTESFTDSTHNVVTEGATVGTTDVKTQLVKLSQGKPDVFVFATLTAPMANAALKQSRELGLIRPIIGNETFSLKAVTKTGLTDGVSASTYAYASDAPALMRLREQYQKQFGHPMQEEIYAALAYDTYHLVYDGFSHCGGANTECVKSFLYGVKNRKGLSGTFSIDANGDTEREFVVRQQ